MYNFVNKIHKVEIDFYELIYLLGWKIKVAEVSKKVSEKQLQWFGHNYNNEVYLCFMFT